MGSPEFAVPILRKLLEKYDVCGVVSQPDKPAGRGKTLTPPPVKLFADSVSLPIMQPQRLKEPGAFEQLVQWQPDLIVVAAYGQILRLNVLELPRFGCINVHASLLPRWRGASPIQAAILAGDVTTGVTIMKMEQGLDTGPIYGMRSLPIAPDDTSGILTNKLSDLGAEVLQDLLPEILTGKTIPSPQDDRKATNCGLIHKDDAVLDLNENAEVLNRKVRAYYPWPVARLQINGIELSVIKAHHEHHAGINAGEPYVYQKKPAVGTSSGLLILDQVQKAGKSVMDGKSFLNGIHNWGKEI